MTAAVQEKKEKQKEGRSADLDASPILEYKSTVMVHIQ